MTQLYEVYENIRSIVRNKKNDTTIKSQTSKIN